MGRADLVHGIDPAAATPADSGDRTFWRILVPVDAFNHSCDALTLATGLCRADAGQLRIVHVRMFDPPVKGTGRFYTESSQDATVVVEQAVARAWAGWFSAASPIRSCGGQRVRSW
jgi:hypothetical protein